MRYRFFKKRIPVYVPPQPIVQTSHFEEAIIETAPKEELVAINEKVDENEAHTDIEDEGKENSFSKKNKRNKKNEEDMNNFERLAVAEATIESMQPGVKVVKKDKGLIERTESSKIILTEDNRQVLND